MTLLERLIEAVKSAPDYNNTTDKYLKEEIIRRIKEVLNETSG